MGSAPLTVQRIVDALARARANDSALAELHNLLLDTLPYSWRKAYDLLADRGSLDSTELRSAMNWQDKYASTVLKELTELDLVERTEFADPERPFAVRYRYTLKKADQNVHS